MTDETTVVSTESTPVPVENAATTPADTSKETTTATAETSADAAASADTAQKRNKVSAPERIGQLTRDKHQLRNENTELKQRLEEIERKLQPQEPRRPNVDDYGTTAEFNQALDKYVSDKTSYDSTQTKQKETADQQALRKKQATEQATQKFSANLVREKANYEGIEQAFADPTFGLIVNTLPQDIVDLIQGSDKNVALAYHLATNLDEFEHIASLDPIPAARELALIEARLELPKPKTISNAPPPVKPVQANSTKEVDISDPNISDAEFNAARRKQRAARRG